MVVSVINTQRGTLLLEILVALGLFSFIITSSFILSASNQAMVLSAEQARSSIYISKANLEDSILSLNQDFNIILSQPISSNNYFSSVLAKDISPCKKNVIASTSWLNNPYATTNLKSLAYSMEAFNNLGKDCDGTSPDITWGNASSSITIASSVNLNNNLSATALDVLNHYAYIGTIASTSESSNFFILDLVNQNIISQLNLKVDINQIDVADNYAYVAVSGTSTQFRIINITNPVAPLQVAAVTLKNVTGSFPAARSIFYFNEKVYIGTHRTAGNEFQIYDVQNPASPIWIGSIELNHNINMMYVRDSYAYLATSGNVRDVIILDISNPASIKQVATVDLTGTEDSESIYLLGNKLYIGKKKSIKPTTPEFVILDISYIPDIKTLGSMSLKSTVSSIKVVGDYAFLALEDGSQHFKFLNITDPLNIQAINIPSLDIPSGISLDYEDNEIYFLSQESIKTIGP